MAKLTKQTEDFSKWYIDLMKMADLVDYAPVKWCVVFKPYWYKMWELIQQDFNKRMEKLGVDNAYFPLLIPESFITKEANHVEWFAPELLTVTRVGQKQLDEPYVIRPTSETIIYDSYSKWIQSYRDLPLKMNQWANVMRWEMKTKPFLRTSEFLWQEGHTAHSSEVEADKMVSDALEMYYDFQHEFLAIEGIKGLKSKSETFPWAKYTKSIEVLAKDGKAIQSCTSHNLGQEFSKAFDISYMDKDETKKFAWLTSWGMSTRIIGTMIMVHGDDKGLRLPPKVAPIQVVIVPIFRDDEQKKIVLNKAYEISAQLKSLWIRVKIDNSEKRPWFKFAEWEVKWVPIRMEIGPRDVENNEVVCARRDLDSKDSYSIDSLSQSITELLNSIHANLLEQSKLYLQQNIIDVFDFESFCEKVETGWFLRCGWCGCEKCEAEIKTKTKATTRCIPFNTEEVKGDCVHCWKPAKHLVLFAKAY